MDQSVFSRSLKFLQNMLRTSSPVSNYSLELIGLSLTLSVVRKFKIFNTNNLWIDLKGTLLSYCRLTFFWKSDIPS